MAGRRKPVHTGRVSRVRTAMQIQELVMPNVSIYRAGFRRFQRPACYFASGATNRLRVLTSQNSVDLRTSLQWLISHRKQKTLFHFGWKRESANSVQGNTVMRRIKTFRLTTDRIYDGGKNFWKLQINWLWRKFIARTNIQYGWNLPILETDAWKDFYIHKEAKSVPGFRIGIMYYIPSLHNNISLQW